MIAGICSFTTAGNSLQKKIINDVPEIKWIEFSQSELNVFFERRLPVVFIGATGIAVRLVSPFVKDKLTDSSVLVFDEKGRFVIPLLSGHFGGGNELAEFLAKKTGAAAVITTATDVNGVFSVDVFAKKNGLKILNREGIKKVSAKILNLKPEEKISVLVDSEISVDEEKLPPEIEIRKSDFKNPEKADVVIALTEEKIKDHEALLFLVPKRLCAGIGCKRGKTFEELYNFLEETLNAEGESISDVCSVSSIDLKKGEEGLMILSQYLHVPFFTSTAEELKKVSGDFEESAFVLEKTGVSNVCERSAVLASENGELIIRKTACDGMTLAVSKRNVKIRFS